jgi:hypothetical protein
MIEDDEIDNNHWIIPMHLADNLAPLIFPFIAKYEKKHSKFLKKFDRDGVEHHEVFISLMILVAAISKGASPEDLMKTFISVLTTVDQIHFGDDHEINRKIH